MGLERGTLWNTRCTHPRIGGTRCPIHLSASKYCQLSPNSPDERSELLNLSLNLTSRDAMNAAALAGVTALHFRSLQLRPDPKGAVHLAE